jgi:hypothetical protein
MVTNPVVPMASTAAIAAAAQASRFRILWMKSSLPRSGSKKLRSLLALGSYFGQPWIPIYQGRTQWKIARSMIDVARTIWSLIETGLYLPAILYSPCGNL